MTSTLNSACPLCGLRYASKPLLELHLREDHHPRRHAQPGRPDVAGAPECPPRRQAAHPAGLAWPPRRGEPGQ